MNKLIYSLTLFVLCSTVAFSQDWINYKSEDLTFIAEFPSQPKRTLEIVDTAVGDLDMHMIMCTPPSGNDNLVYNVIRSDYPKSLFEDANAEFNNDTLDRAVDGAVNNVNGELLYSNKVTFNGFPGKNVKIKISGGFIYINAYLVNNTMFIAQVICLTENDKNESINRFFNSFDIIKVKE
ncbi:hypothetical protein [Lacinutrix venerupis]|uniref:hypothetical protein n=1 Tax=Lacinutrix venerupis TaxID=1486034 RepID=UPI0012EB5B53|nr:hypothetical protein [Lacinutrix venerupis]